MDYALNLTEELNIRKGTLTTEQHQTVDLLGEDVGFVTKCLRMKTVEMEINEKCSGLS